MNLYQFHNSRLWLQSMLYMKYIHDYYQNMAILVLITRPLLQHTVERWTISAMDVNNPLFGSFPPVQQQLRLWLLMQFKPLAHLLEDIFRHYAH